MRAVGIILAGGNSRKMRELTSKRAAAAMPIAGSYRAIDFTLSNMTNSHIQKVAVNISILPSGGILAESREACMYLRQRSRTIMDTGTAERQTRFIRILISSGNAMSHT